MSDSLPPYGLYSPRNSPGQNTGVGSLSLLQIFLTQGSNPGPPHCRRILYHLNHTGSPRVLEWVVYPFSRGSSRPRNRTGVSWLQVDSLPTELSGKLHLTPEMSLILLRLCCAQGLNIKLNQFLQTLCVFSDEITSFLCLPGSCRTWKVLTSVFFFRIVLILMDVVVHIK